MPSLGKRLATLTGIPIVLALHVWLVAVHFSDCMNRYLSVSFERVL